MNTDEISGVVERTTVCLKNPLRAKPLEKKDLDILNVLNSELNLNLDLESQDKLKVLKIIGKEIRKNLTLHDLHMLGISQRRLGQIYLNLQGYTAKFDPLGSFGARELMFG